MAGPKHPHVQAAETYARRVVAGKIPACKWVRLACERHLRDRKREKERGFPYRFDAAAAEKVCRFIELLPHTKGQWARKAERIRLEPWQCFQTAAIFGWKRKADGLRRFRRVFLLIPRKNGKSLLAASWGLYMFAADGEFGAEVYSGATTEKQAWEVFGPARLIAVRTKPLCDAFGISVQASNLHRLADGSKFEPIIGNPGDGSSPSCAIHDEYHEHDTDAQVETMATGMGAREQPLQIMITTSGSNLAGPCYQAQLDAQKMLEGVIEDDELWACIYGVDSEDDWTSPAVLVKANPNIDVSVSAEFLRARQREAIATARKQTVFKTKHLNVWVSARDAYFNTQRWIEAGRPWLKLSDFAGQPCTVGLDLASKVDIAAVQILFRLGDCEPTDVVRKLLGEGFEYAQFGRHYLPEATVDAGENDHYRGWSNEGRITVTDGEITDYREIEEDILDIMAAHTVERLAYDPHQATMLVNRLMDAGVPVLEFKPTVLNFSEPMKELDGLTRGWKVAHDGCPVMTWMMSNVTGRHDAKDNVYPRKERPEAKIDGPVALISALGALLGAKFEAEPEVIVL